MSASALPALALLRDTTARRSARGGHGPSGNSAWPNSVLGSLFPRFKAKLRQNQLELLSSVCAALDRLGTGASGSDGGVRCVLNLSPQGMKIALDTSGADDVLVFVELMQPEVFAEFKIQSQSENCILLELALGNLNRALTSAKSSRQAMEWTLKLAKRQGPCLTLETKAAPGLEIDIVHEIPVKLLPLAEARKYEPPLIDEPQVRGPPRTPKPLARLASMRGAASAAARRGLV